MRKNCLINERSLLLYQFTRTAIKLSAIIIVGYHCYQFIQNSIEYPSLKVKSIYICLYMKLLVFINVRFEATD
jgi:hypothetical protein